MTTDMTTGMTIGVGALELLILVATTLVAVAPVILLVLWFRDRKGGRLW